VGNRRGVGGESQAASGRAACGRTAAARRWAGVETPNVAIQEELPCIRCGYLLRGLAPDASCPECGTPVSQSILGGAMANGDPLYVGRLQMAFTAGLLSSATILLYTGGAWLDYLASMRGLSVLTMSLAWWTSAFYLSSLWLVASRDPSAVSASSEERERHALRVLTGAWLAVTLLRELVNEGRLARGVTTAFAVVAMAVSVAVLLLYYRRVWRLSGLVPDPFIMKHVTLVAAAGVLHQVFERGVALVQYVTGSADIRRNPTLPYVAALITIVYLVYDVVLMRRAQRTFAATAAIARDRWGRRNSAG
jgi:hypothetical protein